MNRRRLGAFTIDGEVGRGGMGVVYRGEFAGSTPVAVKVIAAKYAQTERRRREFRREVHAMARLNHPQIVTVFDTGVTDDVGGARPWYAMELIDGAPLCGSVITDGWRQIKTLVLDLLDALAHAHARGVIHRDLKPGNVLVSSDDSGLHATLVDFGIAHALHRDAERSNTPATHVTGTPKYMAPEQITGRWRDEGPWTDLYALGCMVWRLVCGSAPFVRDSSKAVLRAHLHDELPAFVPVFDVPDDLEDWLRGLLEKSPQHRCRRAADAAQALVDLGAAVPGSSGSAEADVSLDESTARLPTLAALADTLMEQEAAAVDTGAKFTLPSATPRLRPPSRLPPSWERLSADAEPKQLTGAGLGLFGLREIPMVDRESTRRTMWQQLAQVHTEKSPRAFVLRGPTGCGKSRLSQWLGRRAHETGCAIVLEARHAPHGGPMDGLGAMFRRFFRAAGLSREDTLERVRSFYRSTSLDEDFHFYDTVIITDAIAASRASVDGDPRPGEVSLEEQAEVVGRFFAQLSRRRPLVLNIEDAQWAGQTLAVVRQLMKAPRAEPLPLLVVAAARDDAAQVSDYASDQLTALCEHPDCQLHHLDLLGAKYQRLLVRRLLGLTEATVERVVERSDGNPLFAIQILYNWVDQGVLTATAEGFMPTAPLDEALPKSPEALWRQRIDHLIGSLELHRREAAREALEIAALLGQHVENGEWEAVVAKVRLSSADLLVDEMVSRNLATRARDGWSFRHAGLCDSLESTARRAGRLAGHHRLCADVLEELYAQAHSKAVARRAHHLYEAGEYERAFPVLLITVEMLLYDAPLASVKRQLLLCDDVLERLGRPDTSPELSRLLTLWSWYYRRMGQMEEALSGVEEAVAMALDNNWAEEAAFSLALKGILLKQKGRVRDAQQTIEKAVEYFGHGSDPRLLIRALTYLAIILRSRGRLVESVGCFDKALAILSHQPQAGVLQARVENALGYTEFSRGNNQRALELFDKARTSLERAGRRSAVGVVLNNIGDVARHEERWEEALDYYRDAAEFSGYQRDYGSVIVELNLSLIEIGQRRWQQAEQRLEKLHKEIEGVGQGQMLPHIFLALAGCAAHRCDSELFSERLESAIDRIYADELTDRDLAWLAEVVGHKAVENGWQDSGDNLLELALAQYNKLGDEVSCRRIKAVEG